MGAAVCQLGRRFSRCTSASIEVCQYCGRNFCADHMTHAQGHDAVCGRDRCKAKWDDLVLHTAYKVRVAQRNNAGLCGIEECGPHPGFQCSLCQGHYCGAHLTERLYPFRQGYLMVERPVSVCARCWQRRKIWRER